MKTILSHRTPVWLIPLMFIVLILSNADVPILGFWELKTRDLRFVMRGQEKPGNDVVILAADENSLDRIGRWPWSRAVMAKAIILLKQGGASAVALDLIFSEPEATANIQLIRDIITEYTRLGLLGDAPESQAFFKKMVELSEQEDHDASLVQALYSAKNVVLPMVYGHGQTADIFPLTQFIEASPRLGFVNIEPDADGAIRRSSAAIRTRDEHFLSLPIRAIQKHLNLKAKEVFFLPENDSIRLGTLPILTDSEGKFYINHYGKNGTIRAYSFADLIDGTLSPDVFHGKLVLIGGAAVGLGDHWATPFGASVSGVEIQATIADNILTQRYIQRPPAIKYFDMLIILLLSIIPGIALFRLPMIWQIPFSLMLMSVVILINQIVFTYYRLILLWVYPILNIALLTSYIFVQRYLSEGREKRFLKQAFQQYLSPSVVSRIMESPDHLSLGGEKKELTVLFSDIRGFTTISESLEPERLVRFMNRYLTDMTKVVMDCEGTLDKYIGDAVMAIYGAPVEQKDHAVQACNSALRMFDILYRKRDIWRIEGLPTIWIGIGINTGSMVVGNIGSEKRFSYTVMGDHVNLASRLESLTKTYGVKIIVSEYTWEKARDHFEFRELDIVRVRGRQEPLRIFELLGKDYFTRGEYAFIPIFHEGLETYRKGEWEKAVRLFEECLALKPNDQPSQLYIGRCNDMIVNHITQ